MSFLCTFCYNIFIRAQSALPGYVFFNPFYVAKVSEHITDTTFSISWRFYKICLTLLF